VQWQSNQELQASNANQSGYGTNTAGSVTTPTAPSAGGANQPATTGSTAAGPTGSPGAAGTLGGAGPAGSTAGAGTTAAGSDPNTPARAMVKMTKADLQNAPEFRYSSDANQPGAAGNTPPNAPRQ
jgi:hypothetical protein